MLLSLLFYCYVVAENKLINKKAAITKVYFSDCCLTHDRN